MAVLSIKDLIAQRDVLEARKKETFELTTSIGTVLAVKPGRELVMEAGGMETGEGDKYLIINCVQKPKLTDSELLSAFGCLEPTDIVDKLFDAGEVQAISRALMDCAGYGKDITKKVHADVKN